VPGAWDADAPVDRERLLQVAGGLAGFAVLEVAAADSFQGASFGHGQAHASGEGERVGVVVPGLAGGRCAGGQLAEAVECLGLADAVAQFAVQGKGLGMAGEGGGIFAGQLLHPAEVIQGSALERPVTKFTHHVQGSFQAGGRGRVVPRFALQAAQGVQHVEFGVAQFAHEGQCLSHADGGGRPLSGEPLDQAQMVQGARLGPPVAGRAGQGQRLLAAGG